MTKLTPKKFYEKARLEGDTDSITSNPAPDYNDTFYQEIFNLMEFYAEHVNTPTPHDFKSASMPLIKWLNENHHPHVSVIVTPTSAELCEGLQYTGPIFDFVKD
jgi:hypothetical protein